MAVTALYLLSLREVIERLHDPFRLDQIDQRTLDGFLLGLSDEERAEIQSRTETYQSERKPRDGVNYSPRGVRHDSALTALECAVNMVKGNYLAGLMKRTDENAPAAIESTIRGPLWYYNRLDDWERRFWEFRGEISATNQPWVVESWENAEWPDRPNSKRQALIDVLQAKYDRLSPP